MKDLLISNEGDILIEKEPSLGEITLQFSVAKYPTHIISMETDNQRDINFNDNRVVLSFAIEEEKQFHAKEINDKKYLKQQLEIRLKTDKNSTAIEGLGNTVYRLKHQNIFDESVLRGIEKAIEDSINDLVYDSNVVIKRTRGNNKQYLNHLQAHIYHKDHLLFTLNI